MTEQVLKDFVSQLEQRGLLGYVQGVCLDAGITLEDLRLSVSAPAPDVRATVYRWLRDSKGYSMARIGELFGKTRAAVSYSLSDRNHT